MTILAEDFRQVLLDRMDAGVEELHSQAESLAAMFEEGGRTTTMYIDEAIVLGRQALEFCPPGHHKRPVSLTWLGIHLSTRYEQLGVLKDLEEAIVLDREALQLRPYGHPDHSSSLNNLAADLRTRYNKLGAMEDLEEAIVLNRKALQLRPHGHPDRSFSLSNLAGDLRVRYNKLGTMEDLEGAIVLDREALQLRPHGHPDRSFSLSNLAGDLRTWYNKVGTMEDLEEAIVLDREALQLRPHGHPRRSFSLNNLAADLRTRYNKVGTMKDLEEAIVLNREALRLRLHGHPDRSFSLNNLAGDLSTRYNKLGTVEDLEEAIVLNQEALQLRPHGHPDRSSSLNNLAADLSTRYNKLGIMEDLEEAVTLNREALQLRPHGHPDRSFSLNNLAVDLRTQYNKLGTMEDLEEAIVLNREALQLLPHGHPRRSYSLSNLAGDLRVRYNKLGATEDLEEAIVLDREALQLRPHGHPRRPFSLNNLAVGLRARYNKLGTMEDLEEAIVLDREALQLRPYGHPDHSLSLSNLAVDLSARYNKLGAAEDLEEAIILNRKALQLRPHGHPDRSSSLNNLAVDLRTRYNKLGTTEDLEEAIALNRKALHLCPHGHPHRSLSLNSLAGDLSTRYNKLGAMEDLEEAIVLNREALQLRPHGHPDRSSSLNNLAYYLRIQHTDKLGATQDLHNSYSQQSNKSSSLDEIFALYSQLAEVPHAMSSNDLSASRAWIDAAEYFCHSSTVLAYETSLRFLAQYMSILPSLPRYLDIFKTHTSSLAVDAFSACLRDRAKERAIELLEQGRSVFWSQLARLRSPLDDVIAYGPTGKPLAAELNHLTSLIRKVFGSPGIDQHEQLWRLNLRMQSVVAAIRELPGLSHFLLPPLFSDLQCAASGGPVIIVNASQYGCDALVVFEDRDPVHIPLSIIKRHVQGLSSDLRASTKRSKSSDMIRVLGRILRELWDSVVSPIVEILLKTCPLKSRIWWCPTAEFFDLPLHAAGPYRKGQSNFPDLYISSYTPTLSALIHSRRPGSAGSVSNAKRFIAIGQGKAPGQTELPFVHAELDIVRQRIDGLATFTQIEDGESCISRVTEELGKNEWVHLACHGLPNGEKPFESAFALRDGLFTIEHIIGCNLENAEFAYLSACHTTVGDKDSPDEAIHLAAAMQFAGFRSVVGTMWAVDDGETDKITSTFYRYLVDDESGRLDPTRAAFALNKAIRSRGVPLDQRALYVHIGA